MSENGKLKKFYYFGADELGLSRAVVSKIFTELKEAGYISMVTRGKYKLSDESTEMIHVTQIL